MKSEYKKALLIIFFASEFLSVKYRHDLFKWAEAGEHIFVALLMPILTLMCAIVFLHIYNQVKDDINELITWFDTDD